MSTDYINQIVDLSTVSPQYTFLESHPKKPDAKSTLYLSRSQIEDADQNQHHTIVGVHIALAQGDPIWDEFHVDRNTKRPASNEFCGATRSLTICCDTLEVHGEFCAPEADVTIFARRLMWATPDACINTSPLEWDVPKAPDSDGKTPGQNGTNGRPAGVLKVFLSVVEGDAAPHPRLVALGGRGQNPGEGSNGNQGADKEAFQKVKFETKAGAAYAGAAGAFVGVFTNSATVSFSPPAVNIEGQWYRGLPYFGKHTTQNKGSKGWPGNGTDALAAGTPGDGGDGGKLTTNSAALKRCLKNDGGSAGDKGQDRVGGRAGTPRECAYYRVELTEYHLANTDKARYERKMIGKPRTTKAGKDAPAPGPGEPGSTHAPAVIECANAWLHPLSLQTVLEYARDLFLAGDRDGMQELLDDYDRALASPAPQSVASWDDGPWGEATRAQWTAAQTEVASMLQRLHGHLDYFGNPGGYTPLLSLQGSLKLYEGETRRALRTMLLVGWVNAETHKAEEASAILGDLIEATSEDSGRALKQVRDAEKTIRSSIERLGVLERQLKNKEGELAGLRTELLSQAETTRRNQAQIKFAIKMAGAICQVIPVGQPVLGGVGKLADVGADLIGGDPEGVPDTVSKMGKVIEQAQRASQAAKKAEGAAKKASEGQKGKEKTTDADAAKGEASAMAEALDGLGPAVSQFGGAIKALQVPQSEVEAELQRLESECPELHELLRDIRKLNNTKTEVFGELAEAFQSLSEGYARLSSNAAATVSMQQQKREQLGRIDQEASLFVRQVGQRSRLTLLKYLYFMVKAYETTMLEPLDDANWELSRVTGKIAELLKDAKGFSGTTLKTQADTLDVLFQQNLDVVRQKLLINSSKLSEVTITRTLALNSKQSPEEMAALNEVGSVVIDPVAHSLLLPDRHLARLSNVKLKEIKFDSQLPDGTDVIVDMIPARRGTLRRDGELYAVYSDAPFDWGWTRTPKGEIKEHPPSSGAEDLIGFILGPESDRIRQKVARPPLWSDLEIRVQYEPDLQKKERPRIDQLVFEMSCDMTRAPDSQRVLRVQPMDGRGSVVECEPGDLAARGRGFGQMIRIFSKDATVTLNACGPAFSHWRLIGTEPPESLEPRIDVKLERGVIAECYWARGDQAEALAASRDNILVALPAAPAAADKLIRLEPGEDSTILGCVPPEGAPDLLQEGEDGWREVNYRGVVGWIRDTQGAADAGRDSASDSTNDRAVSRPAMRPRAVRARDSAQP